MRCRRRMLLTVFLLPLVGCAGDQDACQDHKTVAQLTSNAAGKSLAGRPVAGLCVSAVYYCSAAGPVPQDPPPGYLSAPSDPQGCDYNRCQGVLCQQNFCGDCTGDCSGCLPPNPCQWSVSLSLIERRPQVTRLGGQAAQGACALIVYYCGPGNGPVDQAVPQGFQSARSEPPGCDDNACIGRICRQTFCRDCGGDCTRGCG